jgi:hypothetical protein
VNRWLITKDIDAVRRNNSATRSIETSLVLVCTCSCFFNNATVTGLFFAKLKNAEIAVRVLFHRGRQQNRPLSPYVNHMLLRRGACFAVAWGGLLGDALNRRVPVHHAIIPHRDPASGYRNRRRRVFQLDRPFSVPLRSHGRKGTEIIRPSIKATVNVSSETRTSRTRSSALNVNLPMPLL